MSGPDIGLADRLRAWLEPIGVQVVEIDGWQTRGRTYATFNPRGSVNHHTAGPPTGVAPSLGVCINGRSDLPGPLCNVHQQRDDVVNVVAAGVANHAGGGGWAGLSGNQSVYGLEVEHTGTAAEPFPPRRYQISVAVHAAFLAGLGNPDPAVCCQHFEWSNEGKIDFYEPELPGGAPGFRSAVGDLLAGGPGPAPAPRRKDDDMPYYLFSPHGGGRWVLTNMRTDTRYVDDLQDAKNVDWFLRNVAGVDGLVCNRGNDDQVAGPIAVDDDWLGMLTSHAAAE